MKSPQDPERTSEPVPPSPDPRPGLENEPDRAAPSRIPGQDHYFLIGEVVTASGPRKTFDESDPVQDVELGEDSGGVTLIGNEWALLWVADGASQTSKVGAYSSRILSQDLGRAFSANAFSAWLKARNSRESPPSLARLMTQSVEEVFNDWNDSLNPGSAVYQALVNGFQAPGNPPGAEESPQGILLHEFAATFSAASLGRDGNFQAVSVGDSYLVLNGANGTRFFSLEQGHITFRLKWKSGRAEFEKFVPPPENLDADGVNLVILSTDGARDTVKFLYETVCHKTTFDFDSLNALKKKIARIRPRTQDDKTLGLMGRFHED